ncbi:MAG: phosphatidylglycerophosphatase A [Planctomycetota bacterium]
MTADADPSSDHAPATNRWTPAIWLATGLGVSRDTPAPGTVGAIWGIPLALAITQLPGWGWQLAAVGGLIALGGPICGQAARDLVRIGEASDDKDSQSITWDEFSTVPLVYLFAPEGCWCGPWLVGGFALHRLFDITKPWPCRQLERLPGGWGIMADDVAAAIYAGASYALLWRWLGAA